MPARKGTKPPNAGKGRKTGTPNKVTKALKDMILEAFNKAGGVRYLVRQSKENPTAFMALVAKVLPTQVEGSVEHGYIARTPPVAKTTEEWKESWAPRTLQ